MKNWLDTYKQLMHRTKWLSLLGSILVFLLVSWEAAGLADFVRKSGSFNAEQRFLILWEFAFLIPLFAALVGRIVIVGRGQSDGYWKQFISFVISVFVFGSYMGFDVYKSLSDCIPSKDGNCYAMYDVTRTVSFAILAAIAYILVSGIRFLVTASVAFVKVRSNLK